MQTVAFSKASIRSVAPSRNALGTRFASCEDQEPSPQPPKPTIDTPSRQDRVSTLGNLVASLLFLVGSGQFAREQLQSGQSISPATYCWITGSALLSVLSLKQLRKS